MIVIKKDLPTMRYKDHVHIVPIGDIHYGVKNCDVEKLKETVDWIRGKDNVYVLGIGDYIEAINYSDKRFDPANIDKGKNGKKIKLDNLVSEQIDGIGEILKPIKHKIIGLLEGNHEETIRLGYHLSPVDAMAKELGVPNLSYSCFAVLGFNAGHGENRTVTIWAHHGMSSGRALGGSINALVQKSHEFEADIYLMGHCHKKLVYSSPLLSPATHNKKIGDLVEKKKLFGITGTFYRTYTEGTKSYAEKAGYSPTETGVINVRIQPFRKKMVNGRTIHLPPHLHISA